MANIVEDTVKFLLDCEHVGKVLGNQVPPSIYRVPRAFRDLSPSSFKPRVVSIGPLHRKATYLHNLLKRLDSQPEETLRGCAEKVIDSIERVKACYAGLTTYDDFELAKMMVIDGCFILEFIQSLFEASSGINLLITQSIGLDLLLIENQIPFFVLDIIFECTIVAFDRMARPSLITHIEVLLHFYNIFDGDFIEPNVSLTYTPDHILGFVHKFYQPVEPIPSVFTPSPKCHSATELDRAGINFKPNEDENWAMAMKLELPSPLFSWFPIFMAIPRISWFRWPTLKMRMASIHDFTELIVRNLLIYEQFSDVNKYVTSYVFAMDMLIDTPQDVALLVKSKVLINHLGSNEDAANMINNLCKEVPLASFFYDQHWKDMDAYYNSYWPYTLAGLKRTYFNNPWSIVTLFAAFLLLSRPSLLSRPHNPMMQFTIEISRFISFFFVVHAFTCMYFISFPICNQVSHIQHV